MYNPTAAEIDLAVQLEGISWAIDRSLGHAGITAADHTDLVAAVLQSMAIRDLAHALRESSTTIDNGLHAIANALP